MTNQINQEFMDGLYKKYAVKAFIEEDPVQFVYQYKDKEDKEIAAFITSALAFGHRPQIIKFIPKVLSHLGKHPYTSLFNYKIKNIRKLHQLTYRFIKGSDLNILFYKLHSILQKYQSLEDFFYDGFKVNHSIYESIAFVVDEFKNIDLPGKLLKLECGRERNLKFLLPHPKDGSACKRMNLFLKWMIRKDEIDCGLWSKIPKSALIIPLDTHVARMSKMLNLTSRKNADWKTALEITEKLREWDSVDPIKYDFSLMGLGLNYNLTGKIALDIE